MSIHNAPVPEYGRWIVHFREPLAAGATTRFVLEYFAPARLPSFTPQLSTSVITQPQPHPDTAPAGFAIDRCEMIPDGLLIEFSSTPGALYEIQYANAPSAWKVSPARIRASANRTQWIDRGPPRTDTHPLDKAARFYRIVEIEEAPPK